MSVTNYPQLPSGNRSAGIAFNAGSQRVALPNTAGGSAPRAVRFATTQQCRVAVGDSTITAGATDMLFSPQDSGEFWVAGCTHVAVIQEAAAGNFSVTPLEDQR